MPMLPTTLQRQESVMAKSCYVAGCDRYPGWIINVEGYGDADSCAEHAGYDDWEAMQAQAEAVIGGRPYNDKDKT